MRWAEVGWARPWRALARIRQLCESHSLRWRQEARLSAGPYTISRAVSRPRPRPLALGTLRLRLHRSAARNAGVPSHVALCCCGRRPQSLALPVLARPGLLRAATRYRRTEVACDHPAMANPPMSALGRGKEKKERAKKTYAQGGPGGGRPRGAMVKREASAVSDERSAGGLC